MIDLLDEILQWLSEGERVAVATVIRVMGSAPRPLGASLVVSSSGRMAGSVSGGCVESAVYEELTEVLSGGPPRHLRFGITEDMAWDVGLACGGTIELHLRLLEPALVEALQDQVQRRQACVLVREVADEPASDGPALVTESGLAFGSCDQPVVTLAQQMLGSRQDRGIVRELARGREVYFEPFLPSPVLVVFGGVHVAIPLTHYAKELGFRVIVVDPRAKFANRERFPDADQIFVEWPDEALEHLPVDSATYLVLLTHDPKIDEPALAAGLRSTAGYIGAIGSRKTHAERFERLAQRGVTVEQLDQVYAPIGLDLGGITPAETALSIMAEVVAVKNGRSGGSLRSASGRIGR